MKMGVEQEEKLLYIADADGRGTRREANGDEPKLGLYRTKH